MIVVVDSFKHNGKTAIYCKSDKPTDEKMFSEVFIDNIKYSVLKQDITTSLLGEKSFIFLLDTDNIIPINKEVVLS